jgi:hypothetical protein
MNSGPLEKCLSILSISYDIQDILERIDFIGPIREKPERIYYLSGDRPQSVGPTGKETPEILFLMSQKQIKMIKDQLRHFFGLEIDVKSFGGEAKWAFRLNVKDKDSKIWCNIADAGFGYSQLLPIIVQGLYTPEGDIFIAEQPEIHLNPGLQSMLGDFFVRLVKKHKKFVILETHSEHTLLRIRTLIAKGEIKNTDVALYYVERKQGKSNIIHIPIDSNGHIPDEKWPEDFFNDTLQESLKLAWYQQPNNLEK